MHHEGTLYLAIWVASVKDRSSACTTGMPNRSMTCMVHTFLHVQLMYVPSKLLPLKQKCGQQVTRIPFAHIL